MKAPTVAELLGRLSDKDPEVRVEACGLLAERAIPTTSALLLLALDDKEPQVRIAVAQALGAVRGPGGRRALERALGDPEPKVVAAVRAALAALDEEEPDIPSPRTPFERAGQDPLERARNADPVVRAEAAADLGEHAIPKGLERLLDLTEDDAAPVRREAARAIGRLRSGAGFGALTMLLGDEWQQVRVAAARALARIGGDRVVQELRHSAKTWVPGSSVVLEALEDLDVDVSYVVEGWLEHPYEGVRGVALEWVDRRGWGRLRPLVKQLATDDEPWIAEAAQQVLGRL